MIEKITLGLKWKIALWFAVFLAGTLFNLWGIGHESIWLDEAFTMFLTDNTIPEIVRFTKVDAYFPLWFIALRLFRGLFGESLIAARAFSLLGLVALAGLGAGPVARILGYRKGLTYSILIFLMPCASSMAQNARMYTWTAFLVTGAVLYGYLALKNQGWKNWSVCTLFAGSALYTHPFGLIEMIILYGVMGAFIILFRKEQLKPFLCSSTVLFLGFLPFLPTLINQIVVISGHRWIPGVSVDLIVSTFTYPFGNRYGWVPFLPVFLYSTWLIASALIIIGFIRAVRERSGAGGLILLTALLTAGTFGSVLVFSLLGQSSIFFPRYFFTLMGCYVLLLMFGLVSLRSRKLGIAAFLLLIVLLLPQQYDIHTSRFNGAMGEAAAYVNTRIKPEDVFVHLDLHTFGCFLYHFPKHLHFMPWEDFDRHVAPFGPSAVLGKNYADFIRKHRTIWLVNPIGKALRDFDGQLSEKELLKKDETLFQTGSPARFALQHSWFMFRVSRFSRDPAQTMQPTSDKTGKIRTICAGFRSNRGKACVQLYTEWPGERMSGGLSSPAPPTWMKCVEISSKSVDVSIPDLPFGAYLIRVFHDANSNGILDDGFLGPKEGLGFSNAPDRLRLFPTFDVNSVILENEIKTIEIPIYYHHPNQHLFKEKLGALLKAAQAGH